jgi:hypothetical protein
MPSVPGERENFASSADWGLVSTTVAVAIGSSSSGVE